jgi:four helix bundle protein
MKESVLSDKSFAFAVRIVNLYRYLSEEHREWVLSKQVMRSGTSIGANVEESKHAQSRVDFVHKLSIAQKEAVETHYWIRLLEAGGYITGSNAQSLLMECEELQRILTSSIKTAKSRLNGNMKA